MYRVYKAGKVNTTDTIERVKSRISMLPRLGNNACIVVIVYLMKIMLAIATMLRISGSVKRRFNLIIYDMCKRVYSFFQKRSDSDA